MAAGRSADPKDRPKRRRRANLCCELQNIERHILHHLHFHFLTPFLSCRCRSVIRASPIDFARSAALISRSFAPIFHSASSPRIFLPRTDRTSTCSPFGRFRSVSIEPQVRPSSFFVVQRGGSCVASTSMIQSPSPPSSSLNRSTSDDARSTCVNQNYKNLKSFKFYFYAPRPSPPGISGRMCDAPHVADVPKLRSSSVFGCSANGICQSVT